MVGSVEKRGISGGQRKRVNIGMELVGLHPIVLMDEPTSGLDATGSHDLLRYCKHLSNVGCTMVAVIHQPRCSSFMLFDHVVLLSRFGCTFIGSPQEAIAYYERGLLAGINPDDNPADALMDLLTYGIDKEKGKGSRGAAQRDIIDQPKQASIWTNHGCEWVAKLRERHPNFNYVMKANLEFDKRIERIVVESFGSRKELTVREIISFFDFHNVQIYYNDVLEWHERVCGVYGEATTEVFCHEIRKACGRAVYLLFN